MCPHRRHIQASVCLLVLSLLSLTAASSFATQILSRTAEQLGGESALVVRGKVSATRSFWNEKHTKIFTEVSVVVDETYKGAESTSIRLLQLGGTVDTVKMTVHGALSWRPNEEVLLFLEPYVGDSYTVSGFSQGKFAIDRDPKTGKPYVRGAEKTDAQLVGVSEGSPGTDDRVPLQQFVDQALGRKGGSR